MNWNELSSILKQYYISEGLLAFYENDERYLFNAYKEIEKIWITQFKSIDTIELERHWVI